MMILKNLEGKKLVLASQSPRRQELLKGLGLDFDIMVRDNINEDFDEKMDFDHVAEFLARKKALAYTDIISPIHIVITADTIVCTEKEVLNKPASPDEAKYMLSQLSGKAHRVITGVCIKSADRESCFSAQSTVFFATLEAFEIDFYVEHYKPYDKAGAYGIQEWIGYIGIKRIEGSYFNVMGFPIQMVYNELKKF